MNRNFALVAVAAASLGGAVSWHYATEHATAPITVQAQGGAPTLTFAPMVRKIAPAVVNISSTRVVRTSNRNRRGSAANARGFLRSAIWRWRPVPRNPGTASA